MPEQGTVLTPDSLIDPSSAQAFDDSASQTGTGTDAGEATYSPAAIKGNQDVTANPQLGKRIADTEEALKAKQRELTDINTQLAARRAVMEELAEARRQSQEKPADPYAFLSDETVDEDWDSHPSKGIKEGLKKTLQTIPDLLVSRDKALKEEIQAMIRDQLNPERMELRDTLTKLESKPWFARLTPAEQIAAAKDMRSSTGGNETLDPTGSPYGNGRKLPVTKDPQADRLKQLEAMALKMFGPDRDVTSDMYPMGKPISVK